MDAPLPFYWNVCLHHPLAGSSYFLDWDSFIFLCNRDLVISTNRAGNFHYDHDLLFEHTKDRTQPVRRRIGGPLESEADNDVKRPCIWCHDNYYPGADVEWIAKDLGVVWVDGYLQRI
jgi:hypothetical protein